MFYLVLDQTFAFGVRNSSVSLVELKMAFRHVSRGGCRCVRTPDVDGHHPVIVNPGPVQNHPSASGKQVHREFVVFDGAAVYPEYVVGINQ